MANDSTTAGYLVPADAPPLDDDALDDFLHDWVQGVTGFSDGTLIRPRWQPEPPTQPAFTTDWIAFGIVRSTTDNDAFEVHDPSGLGSDTVMLTEELEMLVSFYGPGCVANATTFRLGSRLSQNRDALRGVGIGLIEASGATVVPALTKERWVRRADISVRMRRNVTRLYQVRTILSANGVVDNAQYTTQATVTGP